MICYSPPMPEPIVKQGIQLPDSVWKAFDERVTAIYGESNKGRKKWLYVVAIKLLMTLDDETIQQLAVASELLPQGRHLRAAPHPPPPQPVAPRAKNPPPAPVGPDGGQVVPGSCTQGIG